jgi:glucosamine--fructose-6-phosphate aminotransferase (isomerizing)
MAYSSAEVLHGPAGMIVDSYPVLALAAGHEQNSVLSTVKQLREAGADVMVLGDKHRADDMASTVLLSRAYLALESACRQRGRSPDKPDNLNKVTLTL